MPRPWLAGLVCAALALMVFGGIVEVADDRVGLPGILVIGALLAAGAATAAAAWSRPSRPALYAATLVAATWGVAVLVAQFAIASWEGCEDEVRCHGLVLAFIARALWWAFALSLALGALGAGLTRRRTTPAQSAPPRQPV